MRIFYRISRQINNAKLDCSIPRQVSTTFVSNEDLNMNYMNKNMSNILNQKLHRKIENKR